MTSPQDDSVTALAHHAALTGGIEVKSSARGKYSVRVTPGSILDVESARRFLRERLGADGSADEHVNLLFVSNVGLEGIIQDLASPIRSMGWEVLIAPNRICRKLRIPAEFAVTPDVTTVPRTTLMDIHPDSADHLASPYINMQESMLVRRDGELVGWVPMWQVTPMTSVIRPIALHPSTHVEEARRRTYLRLSIFNVAVDSQCAQGRSVLSWLPDSGDPVNPLKLSVAGAATLTHWMTTTVRRDLTPITPQNRSHYSLQSA